MELDSKTIGETLKRLRAARCMSQEEVARKAGISRKQYDHLEQGHRWHHVEKVDAALRAMGGKMVMGADNLDETLFLRYQNELEEMNQLLIDTATLIRALEYRVVVINNRLGTTMAAVNIDGWERIPYNYELEGLIHDDSRDE